MPFEQNANDPIQKEIDSYIWFHSIELPGGYVTPGGKKLAIMKQEYGNTFDRISVKDRTVLDVGAWNGAFTLEALRRGAARVTALDHYVWNRPKFQGRKTFEFVMRQTASNVDAADIDLDQRRLDLSGLGEFDIVLFLGVFYHLKDPLAVLRELALITREVMVVETYVELSLDEAIPSMRFFPGAELSRDPTNWWGPNVNCLTELLKENGFRSIEVGAGSAHNRRVFHAYK